MIGKTVTTPYGVGEVLRNGGTVAGALSRRYLVKMFDSQSLPDSLPGLHDHQGGLWFADTELKIIEKEGK